MIKRIIYFFILFFATQSVYSQIQDTLVLQDSAGRATVVRDSNYERSADKVPIVDTVKDKRGHTPRGATLRSLVLPGWGQVYNHRIWKVPIVYAAIGVPVYLFAYNKQWYDRTRYAIRMLADEVIDSVMLSKVHPELKRFVEEKQVGSLIGYRSDFRKNMDYSILFGLVMWGLNIVDATVDAHLRDFDVSDELSLRVRPVLLPGTLTPGLSIIVKIK